MEPEVQESANMNEEERSCSMQKVKNQAIRHVWCQRSENNTSEISASEPKCIDDKDCIADMMSLKISHEQSNRNLKNRCKESEMSSCENPATNGSSKTASPESDSFPTDNSADSWDCQYIVNCNYLEDKDVGMWSSESTETNESPDDLEDKNTSEGNDFSNSASDIYDASFKIDTWVMEGTGNLEQQGNASNEDDVPVRKIFVGNLVHRIKKKELKEVFCKYGNVVDVHISRDRYTFKYKNYGFVTYLKAEEASRALKAPRSELKLQGQQLRVFPADQKHQPGRNKPVKPRARHYQNKQRIQSSQADTENNKDVQNNNKDEPETDDGKCKINDLNADCLLHIFSFLSLRDRIRLERVCKLWKFLLKILWEQQKYLDFRSLFSHVNKTALNTSILCGLLKRCSGNLVSLDLSCRPHHLNAKTMQAVAKYCRSIQKMNLKSMPMHAYGIHAMAKYCTDLKWISLEDCSGIKDRDIQSLFKRCKELENINLSQNARISTKCFHNIPSGVKEVILNDCGNIRCKNLVVGLKRLPKLRKLNLDACMSLTASDIVEICENAPTLEVLSLAQYFPLLGTGSLIAISNLKNLKVLNVQMNSCVNDALLKALSVECVHLETLDISGCSTSSTEKGVTDRGFQHISSLRKLVHLSSSYLGNVTDEALIHLSDKGILKKLVCRGCPSFTDTGCSRIVSSCTDLEEFDFSGCDLVSEVTLKAALESVKLRTRPLKLKLTIGGTEAVLYEDSIEKNPLLEINVLNLCLQHLRPDFSDDIYFASPDITDEEFDDDDDDIYDDLEFEIPRGDDIEFMVDILDEDELDDFFGDIY